SVLQDFDRREQAGDAVRRSDWNRPGYARRQGNSARQHASATYRFGRRALPGPQHRRGSPINSAIVSVAGSARTRSSADGQWSLENLRPGTRILEVRAIGYFPVRRPVDVVADAPPVRV